MEILINHQLPPVSETLFIPLAARAQEFQRKHPVILDPKSLEILQKVNLEGKISDGGDIASHGILARTRIMDEEAGKLLSQDANAVIINLGAGLDTRINRLDNGVLRWYDVDLPEVIELRKRFFSENDRITFIPASVLDETWTEAIHVPPHCPVIIIAEGLLMYFTEEEVAAILALLYRRFPGAHMLFDVIHSYFINKGISSAFLWGIDQAKQIERLHTSITLLQSWST